VRIWVNFGVTNLLHVNVLFDSDRVVVVVAERAWSVSLESRILIEPGLVLVNKEVCMVLMRTGWGPVRREDHHRRDSSPKEGVC